MKHVKIFESIDVWQQHPKFKEAVDKIVQPLKDGEVEGGANWVIEYLGSEFPQSKSFARSVLVAASSEINPKMNYYRRENEI